MFSIINDIREKPFKPLPSRVQPFIQELLSKLLEKDPNSRPDANTLLSDPQIKEYAVKVIKKLALEDFDSALKLEDQLKGFIPSTLNPTGIVNNLSLSKCATTSEEVKYLKTILGKEKIILQRIFYYKSPDPTLSTLQAAFHKNCDRKRPTITLMKEKHGPCFGGLTVAQWQAH